MGNLKETPSFNEFTTLGDYMKFDKSPRNASSEESGPSIYLKLKAGDVVQGVFRGDPFCFYAKWDGKKSNRTTEEDPDAKFRFKINFVMNENGVFTPKIWEGAAGTYYVLKDLSEMCELEKTAVNIKRTGEGKQTTYLIVPRTPPLDQKALDNLNALKLHELK